MFSIHPLDFEVHDFSEGEVANVYRDPSNRFEYVRVESQDGDVVFIGCASPGAQNSGKSLTRLKEEVWIHRSRLTDNSLIAACYLG